MEFGSIQTETEEELEMPASIEETVLSLE